MTPSRSFASDNNAGVHPDILRAVHEVNSGHVVGYGDDPYTAAAIAKFNQQFGDDIEVFFVFNGTAANCLSLKAITESHHAIICSESAHIYTDECGAPERFTGCKLLPIQARDGKITVNDASHAYHGIGDQHHVQPRVISITQSTEMGTVYTPEEIKAFANYAHERGLFLHVDGARIANAAASLGISLRAITRDCGVDVLSFGGTKNGAMGAEAVVFFDRKLAEGFLYRRKQGMQLASKMRYIAAQFSALLTNDLWLKNAQHANAMAQKLQAAIADVPGVHPVYPVQANGVFAKLPAHAIPRLQQRYFFYVWNEEESVARWMCSWDTTEEDIREFTAYLAELVGEKVGA